MLVYIALILAAAGAGYAGYVMRRRHAAQRRSARRRAARIFIETPDSLK